MASGSSREAILDAAEDLMASRGYAAASITAICRASGLPVGSIYHHFGSKAGILTAVAERAGARFLAMVTELDEPGAPAERRMRLLFDAAPELTLVNMRYIRIWNDSLGNGDRALLDRFAAVGDITITAVAQAIRPVAADAGVADPDALALRLARLSTTYVRGALLTAEYDPGRLRAEMEPLYDVVRAAVTARAEADRRSACDAQVPVPTGSRRP